MTELVADDKLVAECMKCQRTEVLDVRMPTGLSAYWTAAYCVACGSVETHRWHRYPATDDEPAL